MRRTFGAAIGYHRGRFEPAQRSNVMAMDVVDYEIKGSEMQFVEFELDPG